MDYFDRGLRRSKRAALPIIGNAVEGHTGVRVRFSLQIEENDICDVSFQASTCVTLVAYCELLSQLATGRSLRDANADKTSEGDCYTCFIGVCIEPARYPSALGLLSTLFGVRISLMEIVACCNAAALDYSELRDLVL